VKTNRAPDHTRHRGGVSTEREELVDTAEELVEWLRKIYQSIPPVDKDEQLDPVSYVEFVLEATGIPNWHDRRRGEKWPRAEDVYDRLQVSSQVENIGATNIKSSFVLGIEPAQSQKTSAGWTSSRTSYEPHPTLKGVWKKAARLGLDLPAKLARLSSKAVEHADDVEAVSLGYGSVDVDEEWLRGKILTTLRSATANFVGRGTVNPSPQITPLLPFLRRDPEGRTSPRSLSFPHMDLQTPEIEAFKEGLKEAETTYSEALRRHLSGLTGAEGGKGPSENISQLSEDELNWTPDDLRRTTCKHRTREAILDAVPGARNDQILRRYALFYYFSDWLDEHMGLPVLPNDALLWMSGGRADTGIEVINHIQEHVDLNYLPHIPKRRCRLIRKSGLPRELQSTVDEDLKRPAGEHENRVYVITGKPFTRKRVTSSREEIREGLQTERHKAPSPGAQKTFELLNFGCGKDLRSSQTTGSLTDHIEKAYRYVRRMDIDPDVSRDEDQSWVEWEQEKRREAKKQRRQYLLALRAIEDQHQPFYGFSEDGRTDRVFAFNRGILDLPSDVRAILCQNFVEVDLKSAHLLIAAWLWDAEKAMEKLSDESYSIWDDLMQHYKALFRANGYEVPESGDDLYAEVKAALKVAVYSAVYGKHAPSIQAKVTRDLQDILGEEAGAHFRGHPVIAELLRKRDEKLAEMEAGDVLVGPTGIRIEIEQPMDAGGDGVDPRSAMATLAQSYEQSAMQVILELERDREQSDTYNYFRTALWLHDGAYVKLRSRRARTKDLNQRLDNRCKELAEFAGKENPMPAFFEIEPIEPPELPEPNTEDQSQCESSSISSTKSQNSSNESGPAPEMKEGSKQARRAPGAESSSRGSRGSAASAPCTGAARSLSDP